jgi:hypothetical protein
MVETNQTQNTGEATQNIAVPKDEIDKLKNQVREKSARLMAAFKELIEANGGKVEGSFFYSIPIQPFGWESFHRCVCFSTQTFTEGTVPAISTVGSIYTMGEAQKYASDLLKAVELIKQAEEKAGVTSEEIIRMADEIKNLRDKAITEITRKQAEKFKALPREELLWQKGGIEVVLKREGGDFNEKWGKIEGYVSIVVRKNGRENTLWADNYITESGAFQRKKFLDRERWAFENYAEEVANYIKQWHERVEKEKREYLK